MLRRLFQDEEGSRWEYALIIAVITIALIVVLQAPTLGANFGNFISRVGTCLTTWPCV